MVSSTIRGGSACLDGCVCISKSVPEPGFPDRELFAVSLLRACRFVSERALGGAEAERHCFGPVPLLLPSPP